MRTWSCVCVEWTSLEHGRCPKALEFAPLPVPGVRAADKIDGAAHVDALARLEEIPPPPCVVASGDPGGIGAHLGLEA